jgi:hypothetical protein
MMRRILLGTVLLASTILLLNDCGPGSGQTGPCVPNIISSGMQLYVKPITSGSNVYTMQLCDDPNPAGVFSVYAGINSSDVTQGTIDTAASIRQQSITQATSAGSTFQVTFHSSDNYFAIYLDRAFGSGYVPDSSIMLVDPHSIPFR